MTVFLEMWSAGGNPYGNDDFAYWLPAVTPLAVALGFVRSCAELPNDDKRVGDRWLFHRLRLLREAML